jgi:hypothetical protein
MKLVTFNTSKCKKKNCWGLNCRIITKTYFLINLNNYVKYIVLKDPNILNQNVK